MIGTIQDMMDRVYKKRLSYLEHDVTINNKTVTQGFIKEIKDSKYSTDTKYLYLTKDMANLGDSVQVLGTNWLIINKDINFTGGCDRFRVTKAWRTVNIPIGTALYKFNGYFNSNAFGIKTTSGETSIAYSDDSLIFTTNSTELSNQIDVNTYFITLGKIWQITSNDKTSEGLCHIHATIYEWRSGDDKVNEIPQGTHFPVTTITSNPNYISIKATGTEQVQNITVSVEGTVVNNPTLTYASDNTSIATVDSNGLVTGVSNGTCNIIVNYIDNSNSIHAYNIPTFVNDTIYQKEVKITIPTDYVEPYVLKNTINATTGKSELFQVYCYVNNVKLNDGFTFTKSGANTSRYVFTKSNNNAFYVACSDGDANILTITCTSNLDGTIGYVKIKLEEYSS